MMRVFRLGRFIYNKPAFLMGKTLVLADLHLGIQEEYRKRGVRLFSFTYKMVSEVQKLMHETKANEIIILGDLKHEIGISEHLKKEVREFVSLLSDQYKMLILKGNHDGELEAMLAGLNVEIVSSRGKILDFENTKVYMMHGNAWPSRDVESADVVFTGHTHPGIEFPDFEKKVVKKCWIVGRLDKLTMKRNGYEMRKDPKVIVFPAFNDLSGCITKTSQFVGPIFENFAFIPEKIYLLDAFEIGKEIYEESAKRGVITIG